MTLYFAWTNEDEKFDKVKHKRHDLSLFSIHISQKEGELAHLEIKVAPFKGMAKKHCFLSMHDGNGMKLLFWGELCHFPISEADGSICLEFRSVFNVKALQSILENMRLEKQDMLALFSDNHKSFDVRNLFENDTKLLCFNRQNGDVTLSSIFKGTQSLEPKVFFKDNIHFHFNEIPYDRVFLQLNAEWLQKGQGERDLFPSIAQGFSNGVINTLTGKSFLKRWPKEGTMIGLHKGRSGYRVVESDIQEVDMPQTGILNTYPKVAGPFFEKTTPDVQSHKTYLRRSWFKGKLVVEWKYKQRRRENIKIRIEHDHAFKGKGQDKHLHLDLQKIDDEEKGTFFDQLTGQKAIAYAIQIAKAHLAASARCFVLSFEIPLDEALDISVDHHVIIKNFPQIKSAISGKVISYDLFYSDKKRAAKIVCAFSVGTYDEGTPIDVDYCLDSGMSDFAKSSSDGFFYDNMTSNSTNGILSCKNLDDDIVEGVEIIHPFEQQNESLKEKQYPLSGSLKEVLKDKQTDFRMHLKDIRTFPLLTKSYDLEELRYSSPKMIQLKEILDVC